MAKYRVKGGKHHRPAEGKVFKPGDPIDPTEQELKTFPDRFELIDNRKAGYTSEELRKMLAEVEAREAAQKKAQDPKKESKKEPEPEPEPEEPKAFPRHLNGGVWEFSDGTRKKMKKEDAEAHERKISGQEE